MANNCPTPRLDGSPTAYTSLRRCFCRGCFPGSDAAWQGIPAAAVIYELHVGTFTPDGTFAAIIPRLAALLELGVTAIEIMPVAQFPGTRNWGYDGVHLYAAQGVTAARGLAGIDRTPRIAQGLA